ncbi:hypothetical protein EV356DRAFT_234100 [Viridothelium virens]|uniref:Uncharacterized protein n=1 Tax=Viridothelium virens TaxID=1048519 RepID=A0A6A6H5X7_VIRVR|nr:hypothetical protein EV356DRAFT_234100 [Viridothelium virens]
MRAVLVVIPTGPGLLHGEPDDLHAMLLIHTVVSSDGNLRPCVYGCLQIRLRTTCSQSTSSLKLITVSGLEAAFVAAKWLGSFLQARKS